MAIKILNAELIQKAFLAGANNLERNKDYINELNVFPVPDGDTGTNMTMTIMSAVKEVNKLNNPTMAELAKAIDSTPFHKPACPVYQNVSAKAETEPETIKANLLAQLTSPVRWTQSVKNMVADGAGYFMEIGPGAVLQGLIKRTAGPDVTLEGLTTL